MSFPLRLSAALILCGLVTTGNAADADGWRGKSVRDYIDWLNGQGHSIVFSSDLVQESFRIETEPDGSDAESSLRQVLLPFGLTLADGPGDSILVVRQAAAPKAPEKVAASEAEPLPEIIVASSRYSLDYEVAGSHTFLDRELTTRLPDVGDDAIRSVARLPGVASGGVSARNHVRGGLDNEQLIMIDGLRLYEPYHLKDFHALSSIIDQNAIDSIDFYSAGYPVKYGDRMSGVVDIALRQPTDETLSEIGLSVFSTHLFSAGRFGGDDRGDWLFTIRRGNLDLVADIVNPDYGSPQYTNSLLHAGWELSDRTDISGNFLFSYDKIAIAELDGTEAASAKYRNRVAWMKLSTDWSDALSSTTILSATQVSNSRIGETDIPDTVAGILEDVRDFRALELRQDWSWDTSDRWFLSGGFVVKRLEAEYRFDSTLAVQPPFDQVLDNQLLVTQSVQSSPRGSQFAAYLQSRWRLGARLVFDAGLRWDQQTYTIAADDDQTSPRFGLLWYVGDKTEIRLGYGQYYQAQEINELQAPDGIATFYPAQRARHLILSLNRAVSQSMDLRVELYQKKYRSLMPRYENVFDPLVLIPELQIDRVRVDASAALSEGAELMLSGENADSSFSWWLGYTWSVIEDSLPNGSVLRSWDQTHMGQFGINWDWRQWNFSVAGSVHTGWPKTRLFVDTVTNLDGSTELTASTTPRNSERHLDFQSLDVRASRQIPLQRGELTVFAEITNLYDRQNPCCTRYWSSTGADGPALQQKGSNWLPFLPSIGVTWQF